MVKWGKMTGIVVDAELRPVVQPPKKRCEAFFTQRLGMNPLLYHLLFLYYF